MTPTADRPADAADALRRKARQFFEDLWADGDPWHMKDAPLDRARHGRQRALIEDRRYERALEVGCGMGTFTRSLAELSDHVVAVEIAEAATARAAAAGITGGHVDLRTLNVMDLDLRAEPPYDLIVLSETIYYLGWLYPVFDVAWLAAELHRATLPGGRLLLVNTKGREEGIYSPWLVDTYRDLLRNVGYVVEREETLEGEKDGVAFTVCLTLFQRPATGRVLVVNADDFGQSRGVNRGIVEAHTKGIVTSASLMVRHSGAEDAAQAAVAHPRISVGLHFDLGEWHYRDGDWVARYEVLAELDERSVRAEAERQLRAFANLLGRPPTHVDSHQHVHRSEPTASVLTDLADRLGVPLRGRSEQVAYRGDFYGQTGKGQPFYEAITADALLRVIDRLPAGWTELGCHPGYAGDLETTYAREREQELRVLTEPAVRAKLEASGVDLRSFHDLQVT